ncbi:MFS transporter [Streptomyces sp. NPDC092295]|uniref:MFS transporter n=1 Tax=Streptomyces sp. NPDC092295 TaxID=3366011 RepID=UPI0038229E85
MVSAPLVQLLDVTVAKIAVLAIQSGLSVSPGSMQLVLAGYTLACACLLITAARLGNGYRYQRLFALGTTVFTAASVACLGWLIAARLVQRAGIGLVAPQTLSRIRTGVSPERRPRALALYGATTGMASPAGPLISGLLVGADLFSLH